MGNLHLLCVIGGLVLGGTSSSLCGSSPSQETDGCPPPFEDVFGRCLYFAELTSTWNVMRLYCQDLGGDLMKVDSADFLYDLIQLLEDKELVTDHFWLGGNDREKEGEWKWTDGTLVKMGSPFWGISCNADTVSREPQGGEAQNCMTFQRRFFFLFHDSDCAESHSAICEYEIK
ncbi:C-type lectin domain family 17, member A-like isoform X1 [Macrobrachium nipponense]|uniref:C-type lectin domain family 17, member A-like isoform X1 n=1 Tax=Macrobrachium nipponense TaxID=159736 RepID=UPI0030C87B7C